MYHFVTIRFFISHSRMENSSTTFGSHNMSSLYLPSKVEGIAWCGAFTLEALLSLLFTVCIGNIAIWRRFQRRIAASQQQNREAQNRRLTRTLPLISAVEILSWLPLTSSRGPRPFSNFVHVCRGKLFKLFPKSNHLCAKVSGV